jgi:hypothetical protein
VVRVVVLLLALLASITPRLDAQGLTFVPAGTKLRLTSPAFTGTGFAATANDTTLTVVVDRRRAPIAVPVGSIRSLQVRRENSPRSSAVKWGFRGLLVGTAVWGISHAFVNYDEQNRNASDYTSLTRGGAFLLYGGGATALGAIYGWMRPGHRWQRVDTPPRMRVTI